MSGDGILTAKEDKDYGHYGSENNRQGINEEVKNMNVGKEAQIQVGEQVEFGDQLGGKSCSRVRNTNL